MNIRLKELRKSHNLNQREVGKIIGVSQRGYSHYENGKDLSNEYLIALAIYYKTSTDYILNNTNIDISYDKIKNNIYLNKLRDLREDSDLTQEYIGKILNIPQTTYTHYENGSNIPSKYLVKLAEFYNTSVDYILGLTNEILPYPVQLAKIKEKSTQ